MAPLAVMVGDVPLGVYLMFAVNLIAVMGGVWRGLSVMMSVRDEIRDLRKDTTGLLSSMGAMKKEVYAHRDTLIELTAELGLKRPGGRS